MNLKILHACLGLTLTTASLVQAQSYREFMQRPAPDPQRNEIQIVARYMFAPTVNFAGLGSVDFGNLVTSTNGLISYNYSDGRVGTDFTQVSVIDGNPAGRLPNLDGRTGNFSYIDEDQVRRNADGQVIGLAFRQFASRGLDAAVFEADSSNSMGWEIQYVRYLNRSRTLGWVFGFSFNGFDSSFNDAIEANLLVREFFHDLEQGTIPALPDVAEGAPQSPYTGPILRDPQNPNLIGLNPSQRPASPDDFTEHEMAATVRQNMELRSALYMFRMGALYNLNLHNRFSMHVGAGVNATYVSADFSALETLELDGGFNGPTRARTITRDSDWQFGPYADANAAFQINPTVNFFSGIQYQGGSSYNQANEERAATVRFNNQVFLRAGFGIRF